MLSTFSFNKFCKINLLKFHNFSTLLNSKNIKQTKQPEQDEIKSAKHQSLVWKLKQNEQTRNKTQWVK